MRGALNTDRTQKFLLNIHHIVHKVNFDLGKKTIYANYKILNRCVKKAVTFVWPNNKDVCNLTKYVIRKGLLFLDTISIPRVSPTFLIYEAIMSGEFCKS